MELVKTAKPQNQAGNNSADQTLYDVFYSGTAFLAEQLSAAQDKLTLAGQELAYSEDGITRDGALYHNEDPMLQVTKHADLKRVMTGKPRKPFEISAASASALQLDTKAFVTASQSLDRNGYQLQIFANGAPVYFNGQQLDQAKVELKVGDTLVVDGVMLELRAKQLAITSIYRDFTLDPWQLVAEKAQAEYPFDFPKFRRSPRIRLKQPKDKVEIKSPKAKAASRRNDVLAMIVPPLGMVILSVLASFMSSANPAWMLAMGGASVLTAGFSVSSYFADKKEIKAKNKHRQESYRKYLVKEKAKLAKLQEQQRRVLEYMAPSAKALTKLVAGYDSRIYERMMQNEDFLQIRLGRGDIDTSFEVQYRPTDEEDELSRQAKETLVRPYRKLKDAPIVVSLTGQTLGLAGSYDVLRQAVQSLLWQIAVLHSYRDVEFITLIPETDYEKHWQDWRWLPHMKIESLNLRGMVHNAQTRDMVLNSFYQILTQRRQEQREAGNEQVIFAPQYVFTILDETWLSGHQLNEFLADDLSDLGVTVIWGKDALNMLPETATTTVEYSSLESGRLLNRNNVYEDQLFSPDHLPDEPQLAAAIEQLDNLEHVETEKNTIPDSIDFLSMYGVKKTNDLNIGERWAKADTSKSLSVPLGVRGKNDLVYLNLHERAHGPHGLIAGTTGSGKSEVIQSYILSLAVNFAPEDVGFLPIDFKGGGMANLFKDLPHMLGSITNLDGAGSARALASIRAELQKRQKLFRQYGVNHINGYTKLYKQGKTITDPKEKQQYPDKPLPHLFLISDEFAELKANEPDFMTELVSTARIGRSLGVHLILATQKPSGVVDDQIWSNSHFKLALKVSDPSDSNEIIKTPDAATITQPGRAYLQVGNNEIYELFQSAWSGADYVPNRTNENKIDERIWLINDYGQAELLTPDLSSAEDYQVKEETTETLTQLEAIVGQIAQHAKDVHAALPDKPWLPPLASEITSPLTEKHWGQHRQLAVPFGYMDLPSEQSTENYNFDISEMKHTAIYGSAGFGKSTAVQTLVMNLARQNTPDQVEFNLFDFGTNGLLTLKDLPHVADLVRIDQEEKLTKFMKRIKNEIMTRKDLFTDLGVATLEQYEEKTGKQLPVSISVIDGYDTIKDNPLEEQIVGMIDQILREGASIGLYVVITALRTSSFRMSMAANIPSHIGLYLVEDGAIREIMGHDSLIQQEIVGRAQIKYKDKPRELQIYLPTKGDSDIERLNALDREIKALDQQWQGKRPAPIPMLPRTITMDSFYADPKVSRMLDKLQLPLALDKETTNAVGFKPEEDGYYLIANDTPQQSDSTEKILLEDLKHFEGQAKRVVFNASERFGGNKDSFDLVVAAQQYSTAVNDIASEIAVRATQAAPQPMFVYIPEAHNFGGQSLISPETLDVFIRKAAKVKVYFIFSGNQKQIENNFDDFDKRLRANVPAGMIGSRMADQGFVNVKTSFKEPIVELDEMHFFANRTYGRSRLVTE
ncbi:Ftsk domain-containing protein [Ligilactobacillus salitolerans]|uniref:Ftsk domain-containing protein n=1 Tax=Ligilactobacillus salitolerans TaxID=1808352 RepID=A0A401ITD8_9LACO|nr:type VII secretion protein EssC [Ligilactobacillus salitolerans]GBG94792.1 Ftsk domain-containing protein [Ligilactobacillus salitolerans]